MRDGGVIDKLPKLVPDWYPLIYSIWKLFESFKQCRRARHSRFAVVMQSGGDVSTHFLSRRLIFFAITLTKYLMDTYR